MIEGHFAGEREEQGQGVLRHFDQAVVRDVRHRNLLAGAVRHVDVIQANPQPRHNPAVGGAGNHFLGDLGPVGHDRIDVFCLRQLRQRSGILLRLLGDHQLGINAGQNLALNVQIRPGVVG